MLALDNLWGKKHVCVLMQTNTHVCMCCLFFFFFCTSIGVNVVKDELGEKTLKERTGPSSMGD